MVYITNACMVGMSIDYLKLYAYIAQIVYGIYVYLIYTPFAMAMGWLNGGVYSGYIYS